MKTTGLNHSKKWNPVQWLSDNRLVWHLIFWFGYFLLRFWPSDLTFPSYSNSFLQYLILSELVFIGVTYYTLWLYRRFFQTGKYLVYFLTGLASWILYIYARAGFQGSFLRNEDGFPGNISENFFSNISFVVLFFLFVTACKYFTDKYLNRRLDGEKKEHQLIAEVNNLKAQIAPHFLFNTLNNLYGLAVDKSDKLPDLMLRLSDLLRHSLYETQKPLVSLHDEIIILKSYIQLEGIRLENDLKLHCDNRVPPNTEYQIAPSLLIAYIENAFKHAKLDQSKPANIFMHTSLNKDWFTASIRNNYNKNKERSATGIGLTNVKRRLELLYPGNLHHLEITADDMYYSVNLKLRLQKKTINKRR